MSKPKLVPKIPDAEHLKKIVIDHLQGEPKRLIKDRLAIQAEELKESCKKLYQSISLEDKKQALNDDFIIAILGSLDIYKNEGSASCPPAYSRKITHIINKSDNLYMFLRHLYNDGHHHLGSLLKHIDQTHPEQNWAAYFAGSAVVTAAVGGLFYFKPDYLAKVIAWFEQTSPKVADWLLKTFTSLRNAPLIGMIYNTIGILWYVKRLFNHLYDILVNGLAVPTYKITSDVFKALTRSFYMAGNVLLYITAGIMGPTAAVFFVLGALTDLVESLYTLSTLYKAEPKTPSKTDKNRWSYLAERERAKSLNQQTLNALWVRLGASLLIAASVIISCIFPNLVLTVSCLVFGWFVALAKESIVAHINDQESNYKLPHNLKKIKVNKDPALSPALSPEEKILREQKAEIAQEKLKLAQTKLKLQKAKEKVDIRKKAVKDTLTALMIGQSTATILKNLNTTDAFSEASNDDLDDLEMGNTTPLSAQPTHADSDDDEDAEELGSTYSSQP